MFILFMILKIALKWNIDENILILLFSSIYIIPDFISSPNTAFIQYLYGITIGLFSIFVPITYLFLIIVILGIVFKIIDRYYMYYLGTKR